MWWLKSAVVFTFCLCRRSWIAASWTQTRQRRAFRDSLGTARPQIRSPPGRPRLFGWCSLVICLFVLWFRISSPHQDIRNHKTKFCECSYSHEVYAFDSELSRILTLKWVCTGWSAFRMKMMWCVHLFCSLITLVENENIYKHVERQLSDTNGTVYKFYEVVFI